jgi:signal transduction histidine kinase
MPPRWRHPLVGYLLAGVLTLLAILLELAVFQVWLQLVELAGIFTFLVVVFVGLNWGAGPCLLSTVLGTFLLLYAVYPPPFSIALKQFVDVVEDGLVLFGGLFVTYGAHRHGHERQRVQGVLEMLLAMVEALVEPSSAATEGESSATGADGQADGRAHGQDQGQDLVAQRLAESLCYALECQQVGLYALEAPAGAFTLLGAADCSSDQAQRPRGEATPGPSLPTRVWLDDAVLRRLHAGETVPLEALPQPPTEQRGPRSRRSQRAPLLVIPLQRGATLVGLVTLQAPWSAAQAPREYRALVPAIAHLGALVIERERLLQEREQARAEAQAQRAATQQLEGFVGIVSHELKTPLTSLILGHQLLQRRLDRLIPQPTTLTTAATGATAVEGRSALVAVQQLVGHVSQQGQRLNRLVSEVLESSRIEADHFDLRREPTNLAALVSAAMEEQRALAPDRTIDLQPLPPGPILVDADGERIGQVLANYLSNALKYSAEDRPVAVDVRLEGETVRVAVTDHGPGLAPSEQERIWQRFYRAEGIAVQSGSDIGLGLGLYISKTIIEAHGGQVGVESAVGQGATFWFTLPLTAARFGANAGDTPTS